MIYSKVVKAGYFDCNPPPKSFFKKIIYYICKFVEETLLEPVMRRIKRVHKSMYRAIEFAIYGLNSYDFDFGYVYDVMIFKMNRLYKTMEHGRVEQEPETMESLKEAIEIVKRLKENEHDDVYHKLHDIKWGEAKFDTVPQRDDNGKIVNYRLNITRPNVNTEEEQDQEMEERREVYERGECDRRKDIDRLCELLKEHSLTWWE